MGIIGFNTPILHRAPDKSSIAEQKMKRALNEGALNRKFSFFGKINEIADGYFSFSSHCYVKTNNYHQGRRVITPIKIKRNVFGCIVKGCSYFTVVIPIYMLFHKLIYRLCLRHSLQNPSTITAKPWNEKLFTYDSNTLKLDTELGLKKKAVPNTINASDIPNDVQLDALGSVASSLGISGRDLDNINNLCERIETGGLALQQAKVYLRAIMHLFNKADVGRDTTKEVLRNIARDCTHSTCEPGVLTKIQKEYSHLLGAGEDDIEQIFLRELDDLKFEILNVMAENTNDLDACWHPHYVSAAQVMMADELGLNAEAGEKDEYHDSHIVTQYFDSHNKKAFIKREFLKGFTPDIIVSYLEGKINGNVDNYGIALHIGEYNEFITQAIKSKYFPMPKTLDELKDGPMKEYVEKAEEASLTESPSLEELYSDAVELYIKDKFFVFSEEYYCDTGLTNAGIVFILKEINILQ